MLCISQLAINSQTTATLPNYIPPSPNAQTFLKYGEFPVSNYTGVPNIDIPIHTINLKDISIPISISYNASGIKVDEEASRIGLGWILNAGGVITHTVVGKYNDFDRWNYFNATPNGKIKDLTGIYNFSQYTIGSYHRTMPFSLTNNMTKYDFYCALYGESESCGLPVDLAPDIFNYSFMGYSGRFIFSHSGDIIKESDDNLIITPITSSTSYGSKKLDSFTITTPDGIKFYFNQTERASQPNDPSGAKTYYCSFYLTSIETVNGSIINFEYSKSDIRLFATYGRRDVSDSESVSINYSIYDIVYLSNITYPSGKIRFEYSSDRIDYRPEMRLTNIYIDEAGENKSSWRFIHEYFTSNAGGSDYPTVQMIKRVAQSNANYIDDAWNTKRLKLKSLEHVSSEHTYAYKFAYNEMALPTKLSTSIDHWNYFNGVNNQSYLSPTFWQNISQNSNVLNLQKAGRGANREPSPTYTQSFILNEVTYPTGGKTKLIYEPNTYLINCFENDPYKRDFMYSTQTVHLSANQNQGGNNIPLMVGSFVIPGSGRKILPVSITFVLDKTLYKGDPELEISIRRSQNDNASFWEYTYNSRNLPYPPISSDKTIERSWLEDISLYPGSYVLLVKGNLLSQLKSIDVLGNRMIYPEEYLSGNPVSIGGGVRIKEITSYDIGDKRISGKKYKYGSLLTPDGLTSGKLMFYPRYRSAWNKIGMSGLRGGGYSVGYSAVHVIDTDGSGVGIGQTFYAYINKPDKNLYYTWEDLSISDPLSRPQAKDENPSGIGGFKYSENGTLLKEIVYKLSGTSTIMVKHTEYIYGMLGDGPYIVWGVLQDKKNTYCLQNYDLNTFLQITTPTDNPIGYLYPAIRPMNKFLSQKIETVYSDGKSIQKKNKYSYNSYHLVSKETLTSENGELKVLEYKYPTDFTSNTAMNIMKDANRINIPIEIKESVNGKTKLLINDYATFHNNKPQLSVVKTNTGVNQSLDNRIIYHAYDMYGNPLYITKDDAEQFVYLWGYEGQYLVAEIKNATYDQVKMALGCTPESLSASVSPNMALIDGLRAKLVDAHISTFTYRPQVGVLTSKDLSGKTTYYIYDDIGRLKEIYLIEDNVKKVLQTYNYSYRNQ